MAVPKKKKSGSRRDMRRANHDRRKPPELAEVEFEGEPIVVPKSIAKSLKHFGPKELARIGLADLAE